MGQSTAVEGNGQMMFQVGNLHQNLNSLSHWEVPLAISKGVTLQVYQELVELKTL